MLKLDYMSENNNIDLKEWLGNSQLGTDIVEKKYLFGNETFMDWAKRVSGGNTKVMQLFIEQKFIPAGRILSNRGTNEKGVKSTLSNCYVLSTNDSIEDIYKTCADMARTYSYGGGVGVDISALRPAGSLVHNSAKTTSGAVSFMKTFDVVTGTIGQHGRRGALMISIDVNHPDLPEFINIKANTDQITNANISIRVNDTFMKAVENNEDYILRWPCDTTEQLKHPENYEYNVLIKQEDDCLAYFKKVKARDLFMQIAKNNWDFGEPGVLYWDRISSWHMMSENKDFKYAGVNPCVSGDTKILTDNGYQRIDSLVGKKVNVWNGYEWSLTEPRVTGHDQEMLLVTMSNGTKINCTKYHKFVLKDGSRVEAQNLKVGDRLVRCEFPVVEGSGVENNEKYYYTMGFLSGNEYYKKTDESVMYLNDCAVRGVASEKRIDANDESSGNGFANVPDCSVSVSGRLAWLSGLIESVGCKSDKDDSIIVYSYNKQFLQDVQFMLNTIGAAGSVNVMRKSEKRLIPNNVGTIESADYEGKEIYKILIAEAQVEKLINIGLKLNKVSVNPRPNRDNEKCIKIKSIENNGVCDTVYCFNEPINHTGIFNGCITAQCAEEPLPDGGACLLGSMNLYKYVNDKHEFDYDMFDKDVRTATIGLNEIQIEGTELHPLDIQKETAKKYRQIGLGIFDLAGALIKMGIKYGSDDAKRVSEKITHSMLISAFEQSCDLNTELGVNAEYPGMFDSEFYKEQIEPFIGDRYKGKYPLNSQLLTIAPTGSISTMINAGAGGGEPIFRISYTRDTKSIGEKTYHVCSNAVLDYFNGDPYAVDESKLPEYFITADKISPRDRIEMQSALQTNIDASISSTINLPKSATVEDVYDIYMYAWKMNLKGVTVFREGCKRTAILNSGDNKEVEGSFNTVNAPKRPKVLDADYYQVKVQGENFIIIVGLLDGKPYELFALPCDNCQKVKNHKGKITRVKKREYKFESELLEIDNIAIEMDKDYDVSGEVQKISDIVNEGHKLTKLETEFIRDTVYKIIDWCEKREYRNVALHVSGNLRTGMRIEDIIKLEEKCGDSIVSFPKAIARVLSKYQDDGETGEVCPQCGEKLINEGGCVHCPACSWSRCG